MKVQAPYGADDGPTDEPDKPWTPPPPPEHS